jgi:hypothetical protein
MSIAEAKTLLIAACGKDDSSSNLRCAIEALPDRELLDHLDSLSRALIETCLYQLVTVAVAP